MVATNAQSQFLRFICESFNARDEVPNEIIREERGRWVGGASTTRGTTDEIASLPSAGRTGEIKNAEVTREAFI